MVGRGVAEEDAAHVNLHAGPAERLSIVAFLAGYRMAHEARALGDVDAHQLIKCDTGDFPEPSLDQASGETEVAQSLFAQTLFEPIGEPVNQDFF